MLRTSLTSLTSLCAATLTMTFACSSGDDGSTTGDPPGNMDPTGVMDPTDPTDPTTDPTDPTTDPTDPVDPTDPGTVDPIDPNDPSSRWTPGSAEPCQNFETGWQNDELCLQPPPADVGFQVHFGPDDYDNPDDVNRFILEPGGEDVVCQFRRTPDFEGVRYTNEQHTRLRTGTHHMILWGAVTDVADPPTDGEFRTDGCQNPFEYVFVTGSQAALSDEGGILDIPLPGGDPPENEGTAHRVMPSRPVSVEMHYVNTTTEPLLREGWINTVYADPTTVETLINPIFFIGADINVPPGGTQIVTADACEQPPIPPDAGEDQVRLLGITGHAHANTTRVTTWIDRASTGERQLIYEAYDWAEPINAQFSSVHENPPPGDGINDGAYTGILTLDPGDTISWECLVQNQTDVTLRFGNQAYTAEMCNIFGFMVPGDGGSWSCFR